MISTLPHTILRPHKIIVYNLLIPFLLLWIIVKTFHINALQISRKFIDFSFRLFLILSNLNNFLLKLKSGCNWWLSVSCVLFLTYFNNFTFLIGVYSYQRHIFFNLYTLLLHTLLISSFLLYIITLLGKLSYLRLDFQLFNMCNLQSILIIEMSVWLFIKNDLSHIDLTGQISSCWLLLALVCQGIGSGFQWCILCFFFILHF